jgi:hypothetical protein
MSTPTPSPKPDDNIPPVAKLAYEIDLNVWITVNEGDTVVRPLDSDINWFACASFDRDGEIVEMWLDNGLTTLLAGDSVDCGEQDETNHDPRDGRRSFLLVRDDAGAETKLNFIYQTE